MERLTNEAIKVDASVDGMIGSFVDLANMKPKLLDVILNGPTLISVSKNVLRSIIRQLYNALAAYEDTGLEPEQCAKYGKADREGRYIVLRDAEQEGVKRLRELAEADKEGRVFITGTSPTDEQAKINWFEFFLNRMRDYSDGDVWGNGDELMCKTEAIADAMCDLLFQLYAAQDEEVELHTGYYDPAEDARSGEEDRCTGWWYVDCD